MFMTVVLRLCVMLGGCFRCFDCCSGCVLRCVYVVFRLCYCFGMLFKLVICCVTLFSCYYL